MEVEKKILDKETIKKLMAIKGETRGFNLKHDGEYILTKKGPEGLKKVEKQLALWGYPIKYKKIKSMDFFPAGLRALSLLAIQEVFGWGDKEIREVCAFHPKTPLVTRLLVKFFYSIPTILEKSSEGWRRYWTVGELRTSAFSEKEKYAVLRLEGFDLHPVFCRCVEGYFQSMAQMVVKSPKITCQETKCPFKGDKYHEFLVKWQ